ncbi:hypothetical protein ACFTS5_01390 [Nocardia sp. NPDC056952]|uniref:hypothetical protein n=1 Tax=Nocardia sp. NPDC056952 TaxID=3345979 RepID=UPI0036400867
MTVAAVANGRKRFSVCAAGASAADVCEIMTGNRSAKPTETDNSGMMGDMNFIDRTTTCR